jgi:hypothetical protein
MVKKYKNISCKKVILIGLFQKRIKIKAVISSIYLLFVIKKPF